MAYRAVPTHTRKDGSRGWRILWRDKFVGTKEKARHVKEAEYAALGIKTSMTCEEANGRLKQLNLDEDRKRHETRRNAIHERLAKESKLECEHLPKAFADKFEAEFLAAKYLDNPAQLKKVQIHWRTAKRIIRAVNKPLSEWGRKPEPFYGYFQKEKVSWEYAKKLLRILNDWGYFMADESGLTFRPIPAPPARARERIRDAYFEAGKSKESLPLTPKMLERARSNLLPEHANWIMIAIWFGLRPGEVKSLKDKTGKKFYMGVQEGKKVVWIYQSKLTNLAREKRFKPIPILYPEQEVVLKLIAEGNFKKPLAKTVAKHFGERVNCYGPRKGFVDLMMGLGQQLQNISAWMGHQSLLTTQRFYKDKATVHWDEAA
jgi:integrase